MKQHAEVEELIHQFEEQLRAAARRIALAVLSESLFTGLPVPAASTKQTSPSARAGTLEQRFVGLLDQQPGLRIEEINKLLHTRPGSLKPIVVRLAKHKKLRTAGNKRATRYYLT